MEPGYEERGEGRDDYRPEKRLTKRIVRWQWLTGGAARNCIFLSMAAF
jgi:hypothetical protein